MESRNQNPSAENNKVDFITYPSNRRFAALLLKVGWGVLIGASTLLGFIVLAASSHIAILVALIVGAAVFGIKATQDVHLRNKEENKLTEDLNNRITESIDALIKIEPAEIDALIEALKANPEAGSFEKLYAHICELEKLTHFLVPYMKAKQTKSPQDSHSSALTNYLQANDIERKIVAWKAAVNECRVPELKGKEADDRYFLTPKTPPEEKKPSPEFFRRIWEFIKGSINSILSFAAGASAAISIGVGIATLVGESSMLAHPFGWLLLTILASAIVLGGIAVFIDYVVTRRQENKITQLRTVQSEVGHGTLGLENINISMLELANIFSVNSQFRESAQTNEIILDMLRKAQLGREQAEGRVKEMMAALEKAAEKDNKLEEELQRLRQIIEMRDDKISRLQKEREDLRSTISTSRAALFTVNSAGTASGPGVSSAPQHEAVLDV